MAKEKFWMLLIFMLLAINVIFLTLSRIGLAKTESIKHDLYDIKTNLEQLLKVNTVLKNNIRLSFMSDYVKIKDDLSRNINDSSNILTLFSWNKPKLIFRYTALSCHPCIDTQLTLL